jgi:uncharacterized protein involved in exopolysaccharide biosynthesis
MQSIVTWTVTGWILGMVIALPRPGKDGEPDMFPQILFPIAGGFAGLFVGVVATLFRDWMNRRHR